MSQDLVHQNFSTHQNNLQPLPGTFAAAATIAPTTFLSVITGNTAISTITAPLTGTHMLCIVPGTTTGFTTGGNVSGATTTVSGRAYLFIYNPSNTTYYLVSSTTS